MIERLIWLVPLAVGGLGAWRPRAGLVALAAVLPLFGSPPGGPYLAALDAAGLAAILTAWRGGRPRPSALTWPVTAFVVVGLATLLPPAWAPPSWRPAVLLEVVAALPGVESWTALYSWRAAADLLLGWGLFQATRRAFASSSPLPLAWGLLSGLATTVALGLAAHAGIINLDAFRPHHGEGSPASRLDSLFFLSGWLSQYVVFAAPVAIAALARLRGAWLPLTALLVALVTACLALTQQRGAWVAAAAQLALLAFIAARQGWRRRLRPRRLAGTVGAGAILAVAAVAGTGSLPGQLAERARSIPSGLGERAATWSGAVGLIGERPVQGSGLGNFAPAYDLRLPPGSPAASSYRLTAHSLYLHVAAERGVLGLVALALLGAGLALTLARPAPGREALAIGLALCFAGAATYGLVQYVYYLRNTAWLLWMMTGVAAVIGRAEPAPLLRRWSQLAALAAMLLIPVRLLVFDRPVYAGDRSFGFHEPEPSATGPLRWTAGYAAERLRWEGETLVMSLANGHPLAGERLVAVEVGIDGDSLAELTIAGGWEEHRFHLGPPDREWIVLNLDVHPTFRPFSDFRRYPDLGNSVDIRLLGVAVQGVRWEDVSPAPPGAD